MFVRPWRAQVESALRFSVVVVIIMCLRDMRVYLKPRPHMIHIRHAGSAQYSANRFGSRDARHTYKTIAAERGYLVA